MARRVILSTLATDLVIRRIATGVVAVWDRFPVVTQDDLIREATLAFESDNEKTGVAEEIRSFIRAQQEATEDESS